jgi:uncharacterized repeat protein (TIGR01451 family)
MQPELTSACLGSIVPGDVEIRTLNAPPDAQIGLDFGVDVVVDNLSSASAYGLEVTATGSNLTVLSLSAAAGAGFTCTVSASGPICRRSVLPAGSSATLRLVTRTTAIAPATLQVSVLTLNDVNTANNVVINTFAARPTLDLLVEFAPASDLLHVGDQVEYNATIRNMGNTTATNAEALIWVSPPALHVVDMSSTVGQCTRDPSERYHCPLDSLAPNAARSVSLRLRAVDAVPPHASLGYVHSTISIDAVADQPVHDRVRSYEEKHVTVAEAVADLSTTVSSALQMQLNTPSDLVFTVANRGPDNAKDVLFRFNLPRMHHELVDAIVVPNVGTCTIANRDPLEFNCNVQSLAAGQSLVVTLRATPLRSAEFQLWSSTEGRYFDPVPSNDKVDSFYSVIAAPPPPPPPPTVNVNADSSGGGGGGGALDPLWLVLLGIALATRLRGRRPQNSRAISGVGQY